MTAKQGVNTTLAIVAIAALAFCCIQEGLDGQIIWVAIAAITGLGGYELLSAAKDLNTPKV